MTTAAQSISMTIVDKYLVLCNPGVAYLSHDLKVALLAWAAVIVQASHHDQQAPIALYVEAYHLAYERVFES